MQNQGGQLVLSARVLSLVIVIFFQDLVIELGTKMEEIIFTFFLANHARASLRCESLSVGKPRQLTNNFGKSDDKRLRASVSSRPRLCR